MFKDEIKAGIGGLETVVLQAPDGAAECHVIPARGGLVSRWRVGTDEVLFLDEASVADRTKNVRGGIPVLFPTRDGCPAIITPPMARSSRPPSTGSAAPALDRGRHGSDGHHAWIVQRLTSSAETLTSYPWPFSSPCASR